MNKRIWIFILGVLTILLIVSAFVYRQYMTAPRLNAYAYLEKHNIRKPEDLTDQDLRFLLADVPKQYRTKIVQKLYRLGLAAADYFRTKDLYLTETVKGFKPSHQNYPFDYEFRGGIYNVGEWFRKFPPVYDPKTKNAYREQSVKDWNAYIDERLSFYEETTRTQKEKLEQWKNLDKNSKPPKRHASADKSPAWMG